MKTLPEHSVDMVMTSPPYYGLRAYKAEPLIWDAQDGCQHEWGKEVSAENKSNFDSFNDYRKEGMPTGGNHTVRDGTKSTSNFCIHCNAWKGQLGSEPTPDLYITHLCDIFDDVKRVLKKTGTIYVNLDDSYAGSGNGSNDYRAMAGGNPKYTHFADIYQGQKPGQISDIPAKSLIGIPARFQLEMIQRGWICRNIIIWHKDSVMPESVKDRFTNDYEFIFIFSQAQKYFFERQFEPLKQESKERLMRNHFTNYDPGYINDNPQKLHQGEKLTQDEADNILVRNKRTTWTINPQGFKGEHYATYPEELCRTPIEASCPEFVCSKCGKPRTKIYEREILKPLKDVPYTADTLGNNNGIGQSSLGGQEDKVNTHVIGLSDCRCGAPFENGVCLDPFSGVATTGVMEKKLGRQYIGIEISEKYHQMAIKRITNTVARMI
jgi:DNA modification methylase